MVKEVAAVSSPENLYEKAVSSGEINHDEGQAKIIACFEALFHQLQAHQDKPSFSRALPNPKTPPGYISMVVLVAERPC